MDKYYNPTTTEAFYETIIDLLVEAKPEDYIPIRVPDADGPLLMAGLILGCIRRHDQTSVFVCATYEIALAAITVFGRLLVECGGQLLKARTIGKGKDDIAMGITYILGAVGDMSIRRIVIGTPAHYDSSYKVDLFVIAARIKPLFIVPDDTNAIVIRGITKDAEKLPYCVNHIRLSKIFD